MILVVFKCERCGALAAIEIKGNLWFDAEDYFVDEVRRIGWAYLGENLWDGGPESDYRVLCPACEYKRFVR